MPFYVIFASTPSKMGRPLRWYLEGCSLWLLTEKLPLSDQCGNLLHPLLQPFQIHVITPFSYIFRVRYAECDPQGVVFNGRYVEYVDVAFTEYIRAIFGGYESLLNQGLDMQVVNLNVSWQSPAKADQVLETLVTTEKIGNTSLKLSFTIRQFESKQVVAVSEVVYVMVSATSYEKISVPKEVGEKLMAGAPEVVTNHAGI